MTFDDALERFVDTCQKMLNKHFKEQYANLIPPKLLTMPGKKFVRVVETRQSSGGRSCFCFVNRENGDILKSAGWKAPEKKHPRGNIYEDDFMKHMTPYGPKYMDQIKAE